MSRLTFRARCLVDGNVQGPLLFSDVPLSFWGGVDSASSEVIDRHHPLSTRLLKGSVLAIPSGRGSCSGSAALLELLLNGQAPAALVFEKNEEILTLGVLIAEQIFGVSIPVVQLSAEDFAQLRNVAYLQVNRHEVIASAAPVPPAAALPAEPDAVSTLALSALDQAMLDGAHGQACRAAMQVILSMARLQGATELINIHQAHIDGCIYTGPGSLRFARQLCTWGATVRVPTTLNSVSVDQRLWRRHGIASELGEPASALAQAYVAMGCRASFTCAPYLLDSAPAFGEPIVWAESNAVVYANSVLGARTLKYPDYLDICIALTGRAPLSGCHLDEHRRATLVIEVAMPDAADDLYFPLLAYHVGLLAGERIPVIDGLQGHTVTTDHLKAFGAAFATTSSAPMFHIAGITPEAPSVAAATGDAAGIERQVIDQQALRASWQELNSARAESVELVALGNPHFSRDEFIHLAELCKGRRKASGTAMIITSGRDVLEQARAVGVIDVLEAFGAQTVTDTCWCMIGKPLIPINARTLMTNSAKYAHYGPGISGANVYFAGLAQCVETACSGRAPQTMPAWLA